MTYLKNSPIHLFKIWLVWSLGRCPVSLVETSWVWLSLDIADRCCRATADSGCHTTTPNGSPGRSSGGSTCSSDWWHHFLLADAACSHSSFWRCCRQPTPLCPSPTTGCCCLSCSYTPPTERWSPQAVAGPAVPHLSLWRASLPARPQTHPPPS